MCALGVARQHHILLGSLASHTRLSTAVSACVMKATCLHYPVSGTSGSTTCEASCSTRVVRGSRLPRPGSTRARQLL